MKEKPYLILGVDAGIGSCGLALLDMANHEIVDMTVHLWDVPQEAKTNTSLAAIRRAARSGRRLIKRTADRKKACRVLFADYGIAPEDVDKDWLQTVKGDIQPLEARVEGLRRKLTDREFAQALYNICARRGYIPHGEGSDNDDAESRKVLSAIRENEKFMAEKGYLTVGELLYESFKKDEASRNKGGDYSKCITNAQLQDEVRVLFEKQREFGNETATEEFQSAFIACLTWQKPTDAHDEKVYQTVGRCTYFPQEKRAAKACLSYELCTAYERLCHTVLIAYDGSERKLPAEIKEKAIATLFSPVALPKNKECKVTYSKLREWMDLASCEYFKGIDVAKEKTLEVSAPKVWRKLRATLTPEFMAELAADREFADEICSALAYSSSEKSLLTQLEGLNLTEEQTEQLLRLPYSNTMFSDYGFRSLKALDLLIDAFEDTESVTTLSEAEEASGLFAKRMETGDKGDRLPAYTLFDETCNNPVVLRVMGRVRRLVNAYIAAYGMPDEIHVELARELKIPKKKREEIARESNKRDAERKTLRAKLAEELNCTPDEISTTLLNKVELWNEQQYSDIYTGKPIDYETMLRDSSYCEIDHVLPYSRTCDDSRMNKVLALHKSNSDKRERTPYEWLSAEGKWEEFELRVRSLRSSTSYYPQAKINKLLETNLDEAKQGQFIARNLNDTRYACRNAIRYFDEYLAFSENGCKDHVKAVAGAATSALRHGWGFAKKDREASDTHHAVDAAIIAACSQGTVQKVAKAHERKYFVPKEERGALFAGSQPWEGFATEVEAFEKTIIPTRMVDHGGTGRLYEDMVYSFKGMNEAGTKGILERSGKASPSGNYVVREDGSALKPDGMVFLRAWWDEETKHYIPEPVYYSDLAAMAAGTYVPKTISPKPRNSWNPIPASAMKEAPVVIRYGDMVSVEGIIGRYKTIEISTRRWHFASPRNFSEEVISIPTLNSIRTKEGLRVIHEDLLGHCYRAQIESSEHEG